MMKQKHFIIFTLVVFLCLAPLLSIKYPVKAQDENPLKIEKIIGLSTIPGTFRNPSGIAIAKDGTIFIADFGESQIEVFDSNLKFLRNFGSIGSGDGQFQDLQQIRIDENDNLYVLDCFLCRIQVFSKEGKFIKKWGEKGTNSNQLHAPNDFVFLNQNEILIADSDFDFGKEKNNLKVFSIDGKFIRNFFKSSKYVSNELYYSHLLVDHKGYIYIESFDIDSLDNGFFKFSQDGVFLCDYIGEGEEEEDITSYLYCTATIGKSFYLYDSNILKKYEIQDDPAVPLKYIKTILEETNEVIDETTIIDPSELACFQDKIYSLDWELNRLTIYNDDKEVLGSLQSSIMEIGEYYIGKKTPKDILSTPKGITIGPDDNIYVTSSTYNEVKVFNSDWEEINSFGKYPVGDTKELGDLEYPFDIVFDKQGYCYVSDRWESYIEVYTKDLTPFMSFDVEGGSVNGLAINSSGYLVVCVGGYPEDSIVIYDISKIDSKKITIKKTIPLKSEGYEVLDIVIDDMDNMIVSMPDGSNILWINSDGEIIKSVDEDYSPCGLLRDGAGNIYVTKPGKPCIQKLSPAGETIWESDIGWYTLSFITMDSAGKLYLTDSFHNVVLVISDETAIPPVPLDPKPLQTDAKFSFKLNNDTITEQETFTVTVMAEKLEKGSEIDLSIQFPIELLTFKAVKLGSICKGLNFNITNQTSDSGFLSISMLSKKGKSINNSGPLLEIEFVADQVGNGTIDFAKIDIKDPIGKTILYKEKKGLIFTIIPADKIPPVLKLKPILQLVYEPSILIEGETEPEAVVAVNQVNVEVKSDGTFEAKVDLQKGLNNIMVTAKDKAGNISEITLQTTLKDRTIIMLYIGSRVIIVNDTPGILDSALFIDKNSGRTMVPLRAIGEAIGAIISFDPSTQRIDITKDATLIQLWIGKPKAIVNGKEVDIDPDKAVSPVIVKGRTFLPLRFIAEQFEFKVEWDASTQRITLTYPK